MNIILLCIGGAKSHDSPSREGRSHVREPHKDLCFLTERPLLSTLDRRRLRPRPLCPSREGQGFVSS